MKIIWNNFNVVQIFCSFNDIFISSYSFKMFWELIGLLSSYHNITDSGCTYASYFTSVVTPEVKAEWSSNLRVERISEMGVEQISEMGVEWILEMGAERSSDSKSGAGWSSNLGVGWNLEQRKCEMGCPLTDLVYLSTKNLTLPKHRARKLMPKFIGLLCGDLGGRQQSC